MMITENCIVPNMPEKIYHADPVSEISASRSFLNTLVRKTPMHAMKDHPRLNPFYEDKNERKFDLGTAAHDYLLIGGDNVSVLDFPDYRTNAAKAERDAALSMGKLPILKEKFADIEMMATAARRQVSAHEHSDMFLNGMAEPSIFWKEKNGRWCRSRPDWITNDGWIDDYKTTDIASPRQWMEGHFIDMGYHMQAYMCLRGYHAVTGKHAKGFRFFVGEASEPFAGYVVTVDPTMLEVAEAEFEYGMDIFDRCMQMGSWPGYSNKAYVAYPSFRANRAFEDVKEAKTKLESAGGDLRKIMFDWMAPHERKAS